MSSNRAVTGLSTMVAFLLIGAGCLALWIPATSRGETSIQLTDATFTDEVIARQPKNRLTSFSLGERGRRARLWFWFRTHCEDPCIDEITPKPGVPLYVKWAYRQDGKLLVKTTVPLRVRGRTWRTWASKRNLKPGTWVVVVFSEHGPVCLQEQCRFKLEVTP